MISIIMPTYNRFDVAKESIKICLEISSNIEYELIVVNDGEELPYKFNDIRLTILKNPKKGVTSARNLGASMAKYSIFFFIDDDMWITEDTLKLIWDLQQHKMLENNYFNLNWVYPKKLQEELETKKIGRYLLNSNYHTFEGRAKIIIDYSKAIINTVGLGSCSFCISKENFNKINGYNEDIKFQGEDIDIAIRLKEHNINSKLATKITCYHNHKNRLEIDEFLDRDYRGFQSQVQAKMIFMPPKKQSFFKILMPFYSFFKWCFNLIPNISFFDKITFRLIGILSSLTYLKAIQEPKKDV